MTTLRWRGGRGAGMRWSAEERGAELQECVGVLRKGAQSCRNAMES